MRLTVTVLPCSPGMERVERVEPGLQRHLRHHWELREDEDLPGREDRLRGSRGGAARVQQNSMS